MILVHNAFDGIAPASWGAWAWLWNVLHVPGPFKIGPSYTFLALYPLVPWVGVMAVGYGFGALYLLAPAVRQKWLVRLGLGMIIGFGLLRFSNLYGDARHWSAQPRPLFTLFSFLNCVKYPPSLCYLLMTLGPGFLLLAAWDKGIPALLQPLVIFGRVPFFYYCVHIPLIHGLAFAWFYSRYGRADFILGNGTQAPPDAGFSLLAVYLVWAAVIVALYPACKWFADLKRRRRDLVWLSYF